MNPVHPSRQRTAACTWRLIATLLLWAALQGCASIVSGQTQVVSVDTPGCAGASCELSNDKGKWFVPITPGTVTIGRSYNNLQINCSMDGATSSPTSAASTTKGIAYGNILLGGLIGAGVDVGTGAAYEYPQVITVPMNCQGVAPVPESSAAPPGGPRLGMSVTGLPQSASAASGEPGGTGAGSGVLVVKVDADSPAARAGMQVGDVVLRANGVALADPAALAAVLARLPETTTLELWVRSGGVEAARRVELNRPADR